MDSLNIVSLFSAASLSIIHKVHRFISKLRPTRVQGEDLLLRLVPIVGASKSVVLLSNMLSLDKCQGLYLGPGRGGRGRRCVLPTIKD